MKARFVDSNLQSDTFEHPIMLFDGECRFCSGSVQFIIRHDKKDIFRFAQLQSDTAQSLLPPEILDDPTIDSVILIDEGIVYTHSAAVLQICKRLGRGWTLLYIFTCVPARWRDSLYRWVAKRRHKLLGKQDSCMIPTADIRRKFI
ncbi:DCC1-like thiol-disulfide oxidoreductase family protein [Paenibacillus sp. RC67]|uniref:thiol-disulfide oxidoreductase DCC family protein n=1 Tax=Paenibacillus sp. RC67 TaxID=3039392 RepID=UPI0024AD0AE8|nr:DCC1-like thiol-disulfide oxidoreductase family protein [Paenibacillus sp. RC67]